MKNSRSEETYVERVERVERAESRVYQALDNYLRNPNRATARAEYEAASTEFVDAVANLKSKTNPRGSASRQKALGRV